MEVGQKYVTVVEEEEYVIRIERDGEVTVNDAPRDVHLESIGGQSLFSLLVGSKSYEVFVERDKDRYYVTLEGDRYQVRVGDDQLLRSGGAEGGALRGAETAAAPSPLGGREGLGRQEAGTGAVTSPMTGVLIEISVEEAQNVKAGEGVAILEAMKTENVIRAPHDGIVKSIQATAGQTLRMDDIVMYIDAPET
jgi:biotin carboxyl carrier protein